MALTGCRENPLAGRLPRSKAFLLSSPCLVAVSISCLLFRKSLNLFSVTHPCRRGALTFPSLPFLPSLALYSLLTFTTYCFSCHFSRAFFAATLRTFTSVIYDHLDTTCQDVQLLVFYACVEGSNKTGKSNIRGSHSCGCGEVISPVSSGWYKPRNAPLWKQVASR